MQRIRYNIEKLKRFDVNIAYVAGLFDGEGSVGIYRTSNGTTKKVYWSVKVSLVGTHRPMIEAVYNHFNLGLFTTQKRQAVQKTPKGEVLGKQGWRWMLTSKSDCLLFLAQIRPFLMEKAEQVDVAIAYCKGEISGEQASIKCKEAKQFEFKDQYSKFEGQPKRNPKFDRDNNASSKLTQKDFELIMDRILNGEHLPTLADELKMARGHISKMFKQYYGFGNSRKATKDKRAVENLENYNLRLNYANS